jgi:hypothetical protein
VSFQSARRPLGFQFHASRVANHAASKVLTADDLAKVGTLGLKANGSPGSGARPPGSVGRRMLHF